MHNVIEQLSAALAGRYEMEREIGAGGMATVYLARDIRHARPVALKVLDPELGAVLGADRFLSEIRVTANLQHPNILPLFDSGEASGLLFYAMPFIEGESLRARLSREKQLPVAESVRIAAAIANALDYAHRHGVIHRDLKPENILLHEGQPLLADFGIALAVSNAGGSRITQTGLSLGTPQYMSPEQATGDRVIDGRTDIYSLGAVLFEMLTGEPPHTGPTAQSIIARVLTDKPRSTRAVRPAVPESVDRAVEQALEKLPADRLATGQEFAAALAGALPGPPSPHRELAGKGGRGDWGGRTWRLAAVALPSMVLGGLFAFALRESSERQIAGNSRVRFVLPMPDSARLPDPGSAPGSLLAFSPDGGRLAFIGGSPTRVFIRALGDLTARALAGTEGAYSPQFSPDGQWLAFIADGQLKRLPLPAGPVSTIADNVYSFSWGDGDVILIAHSPGPTSGLWRVPPGGGAPERVTAPDTTRGDFLHMWPTVLPGGKAAVFNTRSGGAETDSIAVVRFSDGKATRLGLQGMRPRYFNGDLLYGRSDGSVAAVAFDVERLTLSSAPTPVLENVGFRSDASVSGGAVQLAVAGNGTLAYMPGKTVGQIMVVDRDGRTRVLRAAIEGYSEPRLSPDGKRLAMTIHAGSGSDVWIEDVETGILSRLTADGSSDRPNWTADGKRVVWRTKGHTTAYDLQWTNSDGSSSPELFLRDAWAAVFAPSGKFAAVNTVRPQTASDIDIVRMDSARTRTRFLQSRFSEMSQRISPDGNWLAYVAMQAGRYEVFVRALTGSTGAHQITTGGGLEPMWAPSGRELFMRTGGKVVSVTLNTAPEFVITRRDTLFDDVFRPGANVANYDVLPDGKTFVMVKPSGSAEPPVVVLGWAQELRERMSAAARKP